MRLTAEHYFRVARERIGQAESLYRLGDAYSLTMYTSGVAVECMLRAFKLLHDDTFDEKHDLRRLLRASGILNIDPSGLRQNQLTNDQIRSYVRELQRAVTDVWLLWENDYRFASEMRLRSHLVRRLNPRMRPKGDILKTSALRLLNASEKFIERGYVLWTLCSKS